MGHVPAGMGKVPEGISDINMEEEYSVQNAKDTQAVVNILEDKIFEFNSRTTNKLDGNLFAKIVQDGHGAIVAGIAGWTWAGACEITYLWVEEGLRNKGIGKKLLLAAEQEAKQKNCGTILIRSYSFQAPLFYERNGFKVAHIIEGFPPGYDYYTVIKTF